MIRIGIVGLGVAAKEHIAAYRLFPQRCEIAAIVEPDGETYQKNSASEHVDDVPRYHSVAEMLPHVDLVSLASPPALHCQQAVAAMRQGVHVLCESPLALDQHEMQDLVEARDQHQVVLSVVSQLRFQTSIRQLRMVLERRLLGSPLYSRVNSYWWRSPIYYQLGWHASQQQNRRVVDLARTSYYLDLLIWIFGLPQTITASLDSVAHDNIYSATLHYPHGVVQFTNSCLVHGERQRIDVHCERGMISSRGDVSITKTTPTGRSAGRDSTREAEIFHLMSTVPPLEHQLYAGQIDNVLSVIEEGPPYEGLAVTAEDAGNVLTLFEGIRRAANKHQPEALIPHMAEGY